MNKLLELKIKIFADGANIKEMFSLNDKNIFLVSQQILH